MDLRWFVSVDRDVARVRLARRHVAAGLVATLEDGDRRAVENDLLNGDEVLRLRVPEVDEVVTSREDGSWVHV
jgi:pantothenate kinase